MAKLMIFLINTIIVLLLSIVKSYPLDNKHEDIMLFEIGEDGNLTQTVVSENNFEFSSELDILDPEYRLEISENKAGNILTLNGVASEAPIMNTPPNPNNLENIDKYSIKDQKSNNTDSNSYFKNRMYRKTYVSPHEDDVISPFGMNPFVGSDIVYEDNNKDYNKTNPNNSFDLIEQISVPNHPIEEEIIKIEVSSQSDELITKTKFKKKRKSKTRKREEEDSVGSVSEFLVILTIVLSLPVVVLMSWGIYEFIMSKIRCK